ncbi:MAG: biotin/lipoyl-containing protein, partial [Acidobacteriaceae bacterium]
MPTNVVMPQMGESIFEGTITKWLKKAGETVQRDEPLFEISTDKVDAEIPSPASGVLTEIKVAEGATVEINTVVAVIAEDGNATTSTPATTVDAAKEAKADAVATAPEKTKEPVPAPKAAPVVLDAAKKDGPTPSSPAQVTGGTDVVMPQMGESIFEGTITKWLKKVGDTVERDEPLFEISTDKVDAEIPSPAAGVLTAIQVPEGATVEINTVVAVIGGSGAETSAAAPAAPVAAEKKPASTQPASAAPAATPATAQANAGTTGERQRSSPLVRRIAKDNSLDLSQIPGTGAGGRITKDDALAYIGQRGNAPGGAAATTSQAGTPSVAPSMAASAPAEISIPGDLVPLSKMRSIIAQRMVESKHTSAHVHSVFKIDMTRIVKIRER